MEQNWALPQHIKCVMKVSMSFTKHDGLTHFSKLIMFFTIYNVAVCHHQYFLGNKSCCCLILWAGGCTLLSLHPIICFHFHMWAVLPLVLARRVIQRCTRVGSSSAPLTTSIYSEDTPTWPEHVSVFDWGLIEEPRGPPWTGSKSITWLWKGYEQSMSYLS